MPPENNVETLEYILQRCLKPQELDSHPWTNSLLAREAEKASPELAKKSPGQRLVIAVADVFLRMTPDFTPRKGARMDVDWGGFAALAAQYFSPLLFGTPVPASPREAYAALDESVLRFVFGGADVEKISQSEKRAYRVTIPAETDKESAFQEQLQNGLKQLASELALREKRLAAQRGETPVIVSERTARLRRPSVKKRRFKLSRASRALLGAILILLLALTGYGVYKIQKIRGLAEKARQDARFLEALITEKGMRSGRVENIGGAVSALREDVATLRQEIQPFLWLAPALPTGDFASAGDLSNFAYALLASADQSYRALAPLVEKGGLGGMRPKELIGFLKNAQPQLKGAQISLKNAETLRSRLRTDELSPETRDLILNKADPAMLLLKDSLSLALELPAAMGAGEQGAQTYLLLAQNEDELRPSGGFITAASLVVVENGELSGLNFVNSGELDNMRKIYPAAPWQLREYMNSPVLVLRDSNWFTDFPTAAAYARYLYSFANDRTVNGVLAFDQRFLTIILRAVGPLTLQSAPYPISAENVAEFMRQAKKPEANEALSSNWNNKAFLNEIAAALLEKILSGDVEWEILSESLAQALNERHLLLQLDSPKLAALLARYGWNGAVSPGTQDFLMAVDSNIGFNKTNAVVEGSMSYQADLSDLSAPRGLLTVFRHNAANRSMVCKQWLKIRLPNEQHYPVTDCYWNYLRVYKPAGTTLLSATPQVVPDLWMINKQKHPGQVDILAEDIPGAQAFGTLEVIPPGESFAVDFEFALPASVLQIEGERAAYILRVQKQPGVAELPFALRAILPENAALLKAPPGAVLQGNVVVYETTLKTDLEFSIVFEMH